MKPTASPPPENAPASARWRRSLLAATAALAMVCAAFLVAIGTLTATAYLRARQIDPLARPTVENLRAALRDQPPDSPLRARFQELEALQRWNYFRTRDQVRVGGLMAAGAFVALLALLKLHAGLRQRPPEPSDALERESAASWERARLALGLALGLLAATAAVAFWWPTPAKTGRDPTAAATATGAAATAAATAPGAPRPDAMAASPKVAAAPLVPVPDRWWPTFRGPGGLGRAPKATPPTAWDVDSGKNIRWAVKVPRPGFSSPVVWDDRLFLTGADAEVRELFCFAADTGKLLWRRPADDVPGTPAKPPAVTADTGFAASTPAVDAGRVYAVFATGTLICHDLEGNRLWAKNLGLPDNPYGHASSLMAAAGNLFVQMDTAQGGSLTCFDGATGEPRWRRERAGPHWSSPIMATLGGRDLLILTSLPTCDAYDPATGEPVWAVECLAGEIGVSAACAGGRVFVANEGSAATAIQVEGQAAPTILWKWDRDLPDAASPLATDDLVFIPTSYGTMTCLDAKTGEVCWAQEFDDGFFASPVLAGDKVFALDAAGIMHIFALARTYEEIATVPLNERGFATPAFVGGRIYLRGEERLFCIEGR